MFQIKLLQKKYAKKVKWTLGRARPRQHLKSDTLKSKKILNHLQVRASGDIIDKIGQLLPLALA